jgi:hypothetical protein
MTVDRSRLPTAATPAAPCVVRIQQASPFRAYRRVGRTLPTTVEAEPEVMAYHYREAGMADAACTYSDCAGDRAAARSAYVEATAHFGAAIEEADLLSHIRFDARDHSFGLCGIRDMTGASFCFR